jgi:hypothetical protein
MPADQWSLYPLMLKSRLFEGVTVQLWRRRSCIPRWAASGLPDGGRRGCPVDTSRIVPG